MMIKEILPEFSKRDIIVFNKYINNYCHRKNLVSIVKELPTLKSLSMELGVTTTQLHHYLDQLIKENLVQRQPLINNQSMYYILKEDKDFKEYYLNDFDLNKYDLMKIFNLSKEEYRDLELEIWEETGLRRTIEGKLVEACPIQGYKRCYEEFKELYSNPSFTRKKILKELHITRNQYDHCKRKFRKDTGLKRGKGRVLVKV